MQGADAALLDAKVVPATAEMNIKSAYFSNVLNILPELSAMLSLRVDNFSGKPTQWSTEEVNGQTTFSPKFGLVYQPILNKLSLFANYMNGFQYLTPQKVTDALVVEAALQININAEPYTVVMRTPGDDVELIRGLLYAEDIYKRNENLIIEVVEKLAKALEVKIKDLFDE